MINPHIIIPLAFLLPALILEIVLFIDSHSSFENGIVELNKIRHIIFAGILQSFIYLIDYPLNMIYSYMGSHSLGMFIESLLFICNLLYIRAFADLVYSKYGNILKASGFTRNKFLMPTSVLLLTYIINMFYPFYFDILKGTMEYVETPWILIPNLLTLSYFAFLCIADFKEHKGGSEYYNLPLALYFSISIFALFLEEIYYELPLIPTATCITMVLVYVRCLKRVGYIDSLSGLYTRTHIPTYVKVLNSKARENENVAGIMLDLNSFKMINDTYGHIVGDMAIQALSEILKKVTKDNGVCFRFGGDEFVIIFIVSNLSHIEAMIEEINKEMLRYNITSSQNFKLSASQGYAIYGKEHDTVIKFIDRMDAKMYENKKQYHSANI